jgi:arylsulfatase A-like enzyme/Tfp pilus assembly protein PilF
MHVRLWGRTTLVAAAIAAVALALAAAWYLASRKGPASGLLGRGDAWNIILVTLDTTRADHIGAYGSKDVETPHMDRLAREGFLFEQAMTTAPLTLPAHSSILTGRFPPEHGVRDNGGFFLAAEQTTLAELLKPRGYKTGAFVAAFVLDSKWGLDQGFDTYFDDFEMSKVQGGRSVGSIQRPGNEVIDKALPWMESVAGDPFFAWIHLYDPHTPYSPPEPFKTKYAQHPYRGEVAFTDAQVGRVLQFLDERRLLDRTVVAIVGDHGESLGEHGENAHGFFIYESATRVPFILRMPSGEGRGRRVADPVRVVDLVPTLLEAVGVASPPGVSGTTLRPLMTGAAIELNLEGYAEALYPLHHYGWSDLRALRAGRYKVIDAPRPELYDLDRDPGELSNLYEERRALADRMLEQLRARENSFEQASMAQPAQDVDPEVRARLAALGYVGSFVAGPTDTRTDRADPKDKIRVVTLMSKAHDMEPGPGAFARQVEILRSVLAEDPNVLAAWFSLGNVHFREGKFREAITYFKRVLDIKPDYDLAVINMASAYRRLDDDEAALAGFEHYLTLDPRNAYVRYQIGEIHLDRGDAVRAEDSFRAALAIDDKVAPAKNALGTLAFRRGDLPTAERLIREALALREDVRLARYNLALIAEARGDIRTAEREYLEELKQHPDAFRAAFNLSRLYEAMGERQLQMDALKQAIEANPEFPEGHILLAKLHLDRNELGEALKLAQKGVALGPRPELAPLGHYVMADIYSRMGRHADAQRQAAIGRRLEAQGK